MNESAGIHLGIVGALSTCLNAVDMIKRCKLTLGYAKVIKSTRPNAFDQSISCVCVDSGL